MNTINQSHPLSHQLTEIGHIASDTTKEIYQSAEDKARKALECSKQYVRQNPLPIVLGALAFGAAIGYLLMSNRRKPTFGERFVDEPLTSVRDAIMSALTPITDRVHDGYDSTRDGVEKAMHRLHRCGSNSLSDRIGRVGNNLKFW